jgi:hypothetical protein
VLWVPARRDAIGFFFLEHLDIQPVEQRQRRVAR